MGSRSISGIPTGIASRSGAIHRTRDDEAIQIGPYDSIGLRRRLTQRIGGAARGKERHHGRSNGPEAVRQHATGLFQARSNGRGYEAQPLAFDRYAPMRWPVVVDCDNPRRLYAGTSKGGMFRSDNAAQSWREINQGIIYKEIWSLVQHPRTGELYVGTGPASVFKSVDRGEHWIDSQQFRTMPES